jgi:trimethylamine:corrinoid methyltransferase-like protein
VSDAQAGHEKTLTALLPALAGANVIYGLGMLEMGITFDFGQLLMDNDFAGMIKYVVRGIPVTDATLSVDVINEVGPFGEFVSHENTYEYMRTTSRPRLIDRSRRGAWMDKGGKDLYQRSVEEAQHILETHKPEPLPEKTVANIQSIIRETERELGLSKG